MPQNMKSSVRFRTFFNSAVVCQLFQAPFFVQPCYLKYFNSLQIYFVSFKWMLANRKRVDLQAISLVNYKFDLFFRTQCQNSRTPSAQSVVLSRSICLALHAASHRGILPRQGANTIALQRRGYANQQYLFQQIGKCHQKFLR